MPPKKRVFLRCDITSKNSDDPCFIVSVVQIKSGVPEGITYTLKNEGTNEKKEWGEMYIRQRRLQVDPKMIKSCVL